MCFSAKASFAAGALLVPTGGWCLRAAFRKDRRYLLFASMPLFFGVQQAFEAFVWIGIGTGDSDLTRSASMGFLFFAFFFWPALVPLGAWIVERRAGVRKALGAFAAAGLAIGIIIYLPLIHGAVTFSTSVVKHSIHYDTSSPMMEKFLYTVAYVIVVIVPLLLSTERRVKVFGALLFFTVVIARVKAAYAFFSVWCFLAAFLSLYVVYLVRSLPSVPSPGEKEGR